jgi:hypothetical protein
MFSFVGQTEQNMGHLQPDQRSKFGRSFAGVSPEFAGIPRTMNYKPNYDRFPMEMLVSVKFQSNWRQIEPNLEQIGSHGRELRGERWGELLRGAVG